MTLLTTECYIITRIHKTNGTMNSWKIEKSFN